MEKCLEFAVAAMGRRITKQLRREIKGVGMTSHGSPNFPRTLANQSCEIVCEERRVIDYDPRHRKETELVLQDLIGRRKTRK